MAASHLTTWANSGPIPALILLYKQKRSDIKEEEKTIPTNHHSDTNDTLRNLQLLSPLHSSRNFIFRLQPSLIQDKPKHGTFFLIHGMGIPKTKITGVFTSCRNTSFY